ncbi:MAG TPA: hypothetical protein GXZ82_10620 [Firmicutes bacterium]|jgi:FkbH-like protein|nr:hypothetical protein [Bacillota bacterium]
MTAEPIKIVFWDLDGTLWPGTLDEDEADLLIPGKAACNLIRILDERGILNSVVSQAAASTALSHLKQHRLDRYFVHAQYGVGSKAQAIAGTLQELKLSARHAAFVDDLPFNRAEVRDMLPDVLIFTPEQLEDLATHRRFAVTSTLGAQRRRLYQAEAERKEAMTRLAGSRASFLHSCAMRLFCDVARPGDLARVRELFLRAHRLSTRPDCDMAGMEASPERRVDYIAVLRDRFGDYGLIAAASLDWNAVTVNDQSYICCSRLAVSCRVQGRGVLEGFLCWLNCLTRPTATPIIIPIAIRSDANQALRQSLRFSGYAAVKRDSEYEWLTLVHPQRLQVPEWLTLELGGH